MTSQPVATTIASAVEEQGAATQEIARNIQQASAGTREVSTTIADVNQSADDTGRSAAAVLDKSTAIAGQSSELRTKVDVFLGQVRSA